MNIVFQLGMSLLLSTVFYSNRSSIQHSNQKLDTVQQVNAAKKIFTDVNAKRKGMSKYTPKEYTKGTYYEGFYEGKALRMINANLFNDTSKTEADLYLNGNQIALIFAKVFLYETPLSVNPRSATKSMEENWYYFHNEILIKWVKGGKVIPAGSDMFKNKSKEMQAELKTQRLRFGDMSKLTQLR